MPPFQYSQYQNPYVQSISSLLEAPGQIEAQRAQAVGNAWGGAVQNAGQAITGAIQQQMDPRRKLAQAQFEGAQLENAKAKQQQSDLVALDKAMSTPGGLDAVLNATPGHLRSTVLKSYEEAQKLGNEAKTAAENARKVQAEHFGYLGAQIKQQNYDPAAALAALHQARETYADDPTLLKRIDAMRMQVIEQPESIKGLADAAILGSSYKDMLKPDGVVEHDPAKELRDKETGALITPAAPAVETAAQKETARHNKEMEAIGRLTAGRQDATAAEVARHNRAMEENAKNTKTSRPLTSGDTNKIADFDTSLNDLGALRTAVKDPGTLSRIQSSLPTWVSELTGGWTDDAKQQNAVIARVRQVIGKALEGGVLRKEDEEKYKQILPVIGDSKAVALSKIEGLEKAITQRRQTELSALEDAGYDVSKFHARDAAKPTALPTVGGTFQGGKVLKIEKVQ